MRCFASAWIHNDSCGWACPPAARLPSQRGRRASTVADSPDSSWTSRRTAWSRFHVASSSHHQLKPGSFNLEAMESPSRRGKGRQDSNAHRAFGFRHGFAFVPLVESSSVVCLRICLAASRTCFDSSGHWQCMRLETRSVQALSRASR
jgi:hypothetical protein